MIPQWRCGRSAFRAKRHHFDNCVEPKISSLGDRWDFLRPWCERVRGLLTIRRRDNKSWANTFVRWPVTVMVNLSLREDAMSPAKLRAIRESLLLLTLVAQVAPSAWKYVLVKHCGLQDDFEVQLAEPSELQLARFALSLDEYYWDRFADARRLFRRPGRHSRRTVRGGCAGNRCARGLGWDKT